MKQPEIVERIREVFRWVAPEVPLRNNRTTTAL